MNEATGESWELEEATVEACQPTRHRFAVHGAAVEVVTAVLELGDTIRHTLSLFEVPEFPAGFFPATGIIQPYDPAEVEAHLSRGARRLPDATHPPDDPLELYEHDEHFWLIDDRWGVTEMNLLRNEWRSWVIPNLKITPAHCFELSVMWPLAQILRAKGVTLVPAAAAVRDGWSVLILGSLALEPELAAMIREGYKIVGHALDGDPGGRGPPGVNARPRLRRAGHLPAAPT